jgi:hypothetical protein
MATFGGPNKFPGGDIVQLLIEVVGFIDDLDDRIFVVWNAGDVKVGYGVFMVGICRHG